MKDRKRYHLVMPKKVFNDVRTIADARGATVAATIIACIRIGQLVFQAEADSHRVVIQHGDAKGTERQLLLL